MLRAFRITLAVGIVIPLSLILAFFATVKAFAILPLLMINNDACPSVIDDIEIAAAVIMWPVNALVA